MDQLNGDTGPAATAKSESRHVAETAQEEVGHLASTAKEQASELAREASAEARGVVEDAVAQLRKEGDQQATRLADSIRQVGDRLRALAEGRAEEAGPAGEYAREAADWVTRSAERLDDMGLEGMVREVQQFARRRPGVFLGAAVASGMVTGRLVRAGQQRRTGDQRAELPAVTSPAPAAMTPTADDAAAPADTPQEIVIPEPVGQVHGSAIDEQSGPER
ncbi:MAG TPA: hypothetical protein VML96_00455 [Egibacteraceae bacterium]|nr:hypothetical protein [Egibacteraceae bacterium]